MSGVVTVIESSGAEHGIGIEDDGQTLDHLAFRRSAAASPVFGARAVRCLPGAFPQGNPGTLRGRRRDPRG